MDQQPTGQDRPNGIYYDIPFEEYCKIPRLNISTLVYGRYSMSHLKAAIDGKIQKKSKATAHGRAIHYKLLEPHAFHEKYQVATPCAALLKTGKNAGAACGNSSSWVSMDGIWYCGTHGPKVGGATEADMEYVLTMAEIQQINEIADKVKTHEVVNLLRHQGGFEATVLYTLNGVDMKSRLDKYVDAAKAVIVDVKTCEMGHARMGDGEYGTFSNDIRTYQYHVKASAYVEAVKAVTGKEPRFVWVVVEKSYPFELNVIQVNKETIAQGRKEFYDLLGACKSCLEKGEWPGYTKTIHQGGLPSFYLAKHL